MEIYHYNRLTEDERKLVNGSDKGWAASPRLTPCIGDDLSVGPKTMSYMRRIILNLYETLTRGSP